MRDAVERGDPPMGRLRHQVNVKVVAAELTLAVRRQRQVSIRGHAALDHNVFSLSVFIDTGGAGRGARQHRGKRDREQPQMSVHSIRLPALIRLIDRQSAEYPTCSRDPGQEVHWVSLMEAPANTRPAGTGPSS